MPYPAARPRIGHLREYPPPHRGQGVPTLGIDDNQYSHYWGGGEAWWLER